MRKHRRKQLITVLTACAVLALVGAFFVLLSKLDANREDTNIARAKELDPSQKTADGKEKEGKETGRKKRKSARTAQGSLALGGYEYDYYDRIETYLLIGTDKSSEEEEKKEGYTGDMADFLLVLFFNRSKQTYGALQIDRDTIVDVPILNEDGTYNATAKEQICISHWYGADEAQSDANTVACVSELLGGLKIDGYYTLNMEDIPRLNHAVGGVRVLIEDDLTKEDPSLKLGQTILLTDEQAEHFVRARMGVGDGENTSRMRRQKAYMTAFYERLMDRVRQEPAFINDLYKEFKETASTDLSGNDISRITNGLLSYTSTGSTRELAGEREKAVSESDDMLHTRFIPDEEALTATLTELMLLEKGEKIEDENDTSWMDEAGDEAEDD